MVDSVTNANQRAVRLEQSTFTRGRAFLWLAGIGVAGGVLWKVLDPPIPPEVKAQFERQAANYGRGLARRFGESPGIALAERHYLEGLEEHYYPEEERT